MTTSERDEGARSFALLLQHIDDGALHAELSETVQATCKQLATLVDSLGSDQKASITLKIDLLYCRNGMLIIKGNVDDKTPKMPHAPTVAWLSKNNNVVFENPRQQKLPLREVPVSRAEPRDIAVNDSDPRTV